MRIVRVRRLMDESGQALIFSALAAGMLLLLLAFGTIGLGLLTSGRAALGKAADAAALAAIEQSSVGATLTVSYTDYVCTGSHGAMTCSGRSGRADVPITDASAFTAGQSGAFGPIPGWADMAGCVGTIWPRTVHSEGTYRICTGQHLASASLSPADAGVVEKAAEQWLAANLQMDGQLSGAHITGLTVGKDGQVTVVAEAATRPSLLLFRQVTVTETAWPGM